MNYHVSSYLRNQSNERGLCSAARLIKNTFMLKASVARLGSIAIVIVSSRYFVTFVFLCKLIHFKNIFASHSCNNFMVFWIYQYLSSYRHVIGFICRGTKDPLPFKVGAIPCALVCTVILTLIWTARFFLFCVANRVRLSRHQKDCPGCVLGLSRHTKGMQQCRQDAHACRLSRKGCCVRFLGLN